MQIENVFTIEAPPDRVYAFLLDVERIVGCVPGAELLETIDENTYKGKVKIKVGPITVSYTGNAEISERDADAHRAVLRATGRESAGSGSARATATMTVEPNDAGSEVRIATDFTVAGRVANFGRGVMEDVSKRLVGQMANCIKANLELEEQNASSAPDTPAPGAAEATGGAGADAGSEASQATVAGAAQEGEAPEALPAAGSGSDGPAAAQSSSAPPPAPAPAAKPRPQVTVEAKPVGAFGLFFSILWDRIKRLFGRGRS